MTRAEWIRRLAPGVKMRCVYRWYWEAQPEKRPTSGFQSCTIEEVRTTLIKWRDDNDPTGRRSFMDIPRASELKADEKGFELYFPVDPKLSDPTQGPDRSGKLMSRYEYVSEIGRKA